MNKNIPSTLQTIAVNNILRIDVSLEGAWNDNVCTIWSRENGFLGFDKVVKSHPLFRPSIELYFIDSWFGIHCFQRKNNQNVFDEEYAEKIINFIKEKIK